MNKILPLNVAKPILQRKRRYRPYPNIRHCNLETQKELPSDLEKRIVNFEEGIKALLKNSKGYDRSTLLTARDYFVELRNSIKADYMYNFCKRIEIIANNFNRNSEDLSNSTKQQNIEMFTDFMSILYSEVAKIASFIAKKEEDLSLIQSLKKIIKIVVEKFEEKNDLFHVLARYRDLKDLKGSSYSAQIKVQKKIIETEEKILADYPAAVSNFKSFVREPMSSYDIKKLYAHDLEWLGELYRKDTPPKKRKIIQAFKRAQCVYQELGIRDRVRKMQDFIVKNSELEANEYYKQEIL